MAGSGTAHLRAPDAAGHAGLIVIAKHPVGPAVGRQCAFIFVDRPGDLFRIPG